MSTSDEYIRVYSTRAFRFGRSAWTFPPPVGGGQENGPGGFCLHGFCTHTYMNAYPHKPPSSAGGNSGAAQRILNMSFHFGRSAWTFLHLSAAAKKTVPTAFASMGSAHTIHEHIPAQTAFFRRGEFGSCSEDTQDKLSFR